MGRAFGGRYDSRGCHQSQGCLQRLFSVQSNRKVKNVLGLSSRHQDDIEHPAAFTLMERQAAWKDGGTLLQKTDFKIIRALWTMIRGDMPHASQAPEQQGSLIAPGELGAKVRMPRVTCRFLLGIQLDSQVENGASKPGAEALAEFGQHLFLCAEQNSLGDNFSQRRTSGGCLDLGRFHDAARAEDQPL